MCSADEYICLSWREKTRKTFLHTPLSCVYGERRMRSEASLSSSVSLFPPPPPFLSVPLYLSLPLSYKKSGTQAVGPIHTSGHHERNT